MQSLPAAPTGMKHEPLITRRLSVHGFGNSSGLPFELCPERHGNQEAFYDLVQDKVLDVVWALRPILSRSCERLPGRFRHARHDLLDCLSINVRLDASPAGLPGREAD